MGVADLTVNRGSLWAALSFACRAQECTANFLWVQNSTVLSRTFSLKS